MRMPLEYYQNNLDCTLTLLQTMKKYKVHKLVFSSSATVYGDPSRVPITEDFPLNPANPYGRSKWFIEEIIKDYASSIPQEAQFILLRYFNPIGAHPSGTIGEDPRGIPNNLMPFICQVAVGKLSKLRVFGRDWPTHDGTGVRDFIHIVDLAMGHIAALKSFEEEKKGCFVYNLGTGCGVSVLEMVKALEKASNKTVPLEFTDRRPGDIAVCFADPSKAERELGWKAALGLDRMCVDAWRWQSSNPHGFQDSDSKDP